MAKPIPDGYHSVTPAITVNDAAAALEFYKKAFGAKEIMRFPGPGGKGIMHAEIQIGDSKVMLGDEFQGSARSPKSLGGVTGMLQIYVENVDASCARAEAAGATVRVPLTDMFWGDRMCRVVDPFGHEWGIATHTEDVSVEEIARRGEEFFAKMASGGAKA